jgi:hypothetical protein
VTPNQRSKSKPPRAPAPTRTRLSSISLLPNLSQPDLPQVLQPHPLKNLHIAVPPKLANPGFLTHHTSKTASLDFSTPAFVNRQPSPTRSTNCLSPPTTSPLLLPPPESPKPPDPFTTRFTTREEQLQVMASSSTVAYSNNQFKRDAAVILIA